MDSTNSFGGYVHKLQKSSSCRQVGILKNTKSAIAKPRIAVTKVGSDSNTDTLYPSTKIEMNPDSNVGDTHSIGTDGIYASKLRNVSQMEISKPLVLQISEDNGPCQLDVYVQVIINY